MANKMVITIDVETGKVEKVTDEKGVPAKSKKMEEVKLDGMPIAKIHDHTIIHTHSSPGCCYYYINGKWYYICAG